MKKNTLTIPQAGYLFAIKILWPERGYLQLFGQKKTLYTLELQNFMHQQNEGVLTLSEIGNYFSSIEHIISRASNEEDSSAVLDLVPEKDIVIGYYDVILRVQKGYITGVAHSLETFVLKEKPAITKLFGPEGFDEILVTLFPRERMKPLFKKEQPAAV